MGCFCCLFDVKDEDTKKIKASQPTSASVTGQFTLSELKAATGSFSNSNLLGVGGYGKVYKGTLKNGRMAAIKMLFDIGVEGSQEFKNEVEMQSTLEHTNLVKLIGYCDEGQQKVLVYEFMPRGSLADHLNKAETTEAVVLLDWETRIRIGLGVAKGLQHLHNRKPPIIHRDIKSSNILLDNQFEAKLGDLGLAKYGPSGSFTHITTRVMGTKGYCAPEYYASGKLTFKSDIYCLGVVLLELITGRIALLDTEKPEQERNLVTWAEVFLKDKKKSLQLIDPSLKTRDGFRQRDGFHFIVIAQNCLHKEPKIRPHIGEVVDALQYLASRISKLL